jgi:hypothetical protein
LYRGGVECKAIPFGTKFKNIVILCKEEGLAKDEKANDDRKTHIAKFGNY